jgi:non-specific serine/threonine protein kinase
MATGVLPFQGETSAVIFDAILNREPAPVLTINPALPPQLAAILAKALEKDRNLRAQTAAELKTDFMRLGRDLDSGSRRALEDSRGTRKRAERSIAVLYFENLSGIKEDEYLRDGVTEDIITELSKIAGLKTFSRTAVSGFKEKAVTTKQVGQQLNAACVLTGSIRRSGMRLRINAQLVDAETDFPLWSERYDREMKDVFELQDEIAHIDAAGSRVRAADVRKRGGARPDLFRSLGCDRERMRSEALRLQPQPRMDRPREECQSAGHVAQPRCPGGPRGGGMDPVRRGTVRRRGAARS